MFWILYVVVAGLHRGGRDVGHPGVSLPLAVTPRTLREGSSSIFISPKMKFPSGVRLHHREGLLSKQHTPMCIGASFFAMHRASEALFL